MRNALKITFPWLPADGLSYWPLTFFRPAWTNNPGLQAHEQVHLDEQMGVHLFWWVFLFVLAALLHSWWPLVAAPLTPWWAAYLLAPSFRQRAEIVAYKTQIAVRGIKQEEAARDLAENYRLNLSVAEAMRLLQTGDA